MTGGGLPPPRRLRARAGGCAAFDPRHSTAEATVRSLRAPPPRGSSAARKGRDASLRARRPMTPEAAPRVDGPCLDLYPRSAARSCVARAVARDGAVPPVFATGAVTRPRRPNGERGERSGPYAIATGRERPDPCGPASVPWHAASRRESVPRARDESFATLNATIPPSASTARCSDVCTYPRGLRRVRSEATTPTGSAETRRASDVSTRTQGVRVHRFERKKSQPRNVYSRRTPSYASATVVGAPGVATRSRRGERVLHRARLSTWRALGAQRELWNTDQSGRSAMREAARGCASGCRGAGPRERETKNMHDTGSVRGPSISQGTFGEVGA